MSVEMEGTFGRVYRASYHEEGTPAPRDVLVKTAIEHAFQPQIGTVTKQVVSVYNIYTFLFL